MPARVVRYLIALLLFIGVTAAMVLLVRHYGKTGTVTATDEKPEVCVQQGHRPIWCVAWAADGHHAISGSGDGTVILWDVGTGRQIRALQAHRTGGVIAVAFLPNDRQFLTAGTDSIVRIWDMNTMSEIKRFHAGGPVTSVAISAGSNRLLCTAIDSIVHLWDIHNGREIQRFVVGPRGSNCSALSSDGWLAVTQGSRANTLALWEVGSGRQLREFALTQGTPVCVLFDKNNSRLLCGSGRGGALQISRGAGTYSIGFPFAFREMQADSGLQGNIEMWSVETGKRILCMGGDSLGITSLQLRSDGRQVLSGGLDSTMELWDVESGNLIREFPSSGCAITAAAISPDGRYALAAGTVVNKSGHTSSDAIIQLWDIERAKVIRNFERLALTVYGASFSQDGQQIYVQSGRGLHTWETRTGRRLATVIPDPAWRRIWFSLDQKYGLCEVDSGMPDYRFVRFWSLDNGQHSTTQKPVKGYVQAWAFSTDGSCAVTASEDTVFTLWNTANGREVNHFVYSDSSERGWRLGCTDVCLFGNGRCALTRHCGPDVCLYNFESNQKRILRNGITCADVISIFPWSDGQRASIARTDGALEFWDTRTGEMMHSLKLETPVDFPILSSSENRFAAKILQSSKSDVVDGGEKTSIESWNGNTFGLWDARTGRKIREFVGHSGFIQQLCLSPDDRYIVSASTDGTARLWNIQSGKEILRLISFANNEWIAITPEGYYSASLSGDAFLNVRVGNKVAGIDQYRSTFYRPAVVEAALRLGDSEKAVSEVLGCKSECTTLSNVPEMEPPFVFVKYPANWDTLRAADTALAFHVEDRHFPIKSVKVFVNGRPVLGHPTRSADEKPPITQLDIPKNRKSLDLKVPVRLDDGDNLITIAALGISEAVDSIHVYLVATSPLQTPMDIDTVWILAVGVNTYSDKKNLRSLNYCVNDARGIVKSFEQQEGKTCHKVASLIISDSGPARPTFETIVDNIGFLHQAKEKDLAVLFLAGHGVNDSYGDFYFLPSDAEMTAPHEFKKSRAISGAMLQTAMEVPARRFVFVDACHSGDIGVDLVKLAREFKDNRVLILTSSEGNKPSEEADSLKHGLFTYAMIKGLQGGADITGADGKITALELITYVSDKVNTMTNHRQNPVFWAPGGLSNFVVAVSTKNQSHIVAALP